MRVPGAPVKEDVVSLRSDDGRGRSVSFVSFPAVNERKVVEIWENQRWSLWYQSYSRDHVCVWVCVCLMYHVCGSVCLVVCVHICLFQCFWCVCLFVSLGPFRFTA
jgi:hypothetical protein